MPAHAASPVTVEIAVIPGIEDIGAAEIRSRLKVPIARLRPGTLVIPEVGLAAVMSLRTAGVAYLTRTFDVPRPRALLGSQQLQHALRLVLRVVEVNPRGFEGLRLSAAGSASPVMGRLAAELADAVGLPVDAVGGDLVVRVYRAASTSGWTVGVRLTPRPLSARPWRLARFPGALDATVAAAMVQLTGPSPSDRFVDLCCGSGTIAVERLHAGRTATTVAVDIDGRALARAHLNLSAAGVVDRTALIHADAADLPIRSAAASAVCSNPPWGHQMGTHHDNERLYPGILREAARITIPGGLFVLLSHQVRLTRRLLHEHRAWIVEEERTLAFRGHHPRIWTLRRT